jgi:hypothetical protein
MRTGAFIRETMLGLHVALGSFALALGPLALWRSKGSPALARGGAGAAYLFSVLGVSATAVGLVSFDWPRLWWLVFLALFSSALVVIAFLAPRRRFRGWTRVCAHGEGGSYIALVTALLVVSVQGPASVAVWALPTLVGLPLIELRAARLGARERAGRVRAPDTRPLAPLELRSGQRR